LSVKQLSAEAGLQVGDIFDEFHNTEFRNAIVHSDFVFTNDGFRLPQRQFYGGVPESTCPSAPAISIWGNSSAARVKFDVRVTAGK
jgi:hypothetical protein